MLCFLIINQIGLLKKHTSLTDLLADDAAQLQIITGGSGGLSGMKR